MTGAGIYTYLQQYPKYDKWKGMNFAMFAEVGNPATRFSRCFRVTADGDERVQCPPPLDPYLYDASLHPVRPKLERAARELHDHLREENPEIKGARIDLWQLHYRSEPPELTFRRRLSVTVGEEDR